MLTALAVVLGLAVVAGTLLGWAGARLRPEADPLVARGRLKRRGKK